VISSQPISRSSRSDTSGSGLNADRVVSANDYPDTWAQVRSLKKVLRSPREPAARSSRKTCPRVTFECDSAGAGIADSPPQVTLQSCDSDSRSRSDREQGSPEHYGRRFPWDDHLERGAAWRPHCTVGFTVGGQPLLDGLAVRSRARSASMCPRADRTHQLIPSRQRFVRKADHRRRVPNCGGK